LPFASLTNRPNSTCAIASDSSVSTAHHNRLISVSENSDRGT
jgi:hypothetical protein